MVNGRKLDTMHHSLSVMSIHEEQEEQKFSLDEVEILKQAPMEQARWKPAKFYTS